MDQDHKGYFAQFGDRNGRISLSEDEFELLVAKYGAEMLIARRERFRPKQSWDETWGYWLFWGFLLLVAFIAGWNLAN